MAVQQDTIRTRLEMDASQQVNEMGKLQYEYDGLKQNLKSINKYNEEFRANLNKLKAEERKVSRLNTVMKRLSDQGKENTKQYEKYQKKLKETSEAVDYYASRQKKLKEFNPEYEKQLQKLGEVGKKMKELAKTTDLNTLSRKQLRTISRQLSAELSATPDTARKFESLAQRSAMVANRLEELTQKQREYRRELGKIDENANIRKLNMENLVQLQGQLNRKWQKLPQTANGYKDLTARLLSVNRAIDKQKQQVNDTRTAWDKLREIGKQAQDDLVGTLGSEAVIRSLEFAAAKYVETLDKVRDRSDLLTDIEKKGSLSAKEIRALQKEIEKLDTRTVDDELLQIAKIGAELKTPREEMKGFVEQVDQINVALGDDFPGSIDETTRELGKMRQVFELTRNMKAGESFRRIGSAINSLGNEVSVQAPELTEFTKRMGQLGKAGPNIKDTLGLGAALVGKLGFTAEIASGGLTALFNAAAKNSQAFAQVLGITTEEFERMVNESPNEMLLTLAKRFQGAKPTEVAAAMKSFGVETQEARKILSSMAENLPFIEKNLAIANKAFEEGTSLMEEFRLKNESTAGVIDKQRNAIARVSLELMERAAPAFIEILKWTKEFLIIIRDLPNWIDRNKTSLIGLSLVILGFKFKAIIAGLASVTTGLYASAAAAFRTTGAYRILQVATRQYTALAKTQGKANAFLAVSWRTLNNVMRANPIGFVITAVWLLVEAFQYAYKESETFRNIVHGVKEVGQEIVAIFAETLEAVGQGWEALKNGEFLKAGKIFGQVLLKNNPLAAGFVHGKRLAKSFSKGYEQEAKEGAKRAANAEYDAYWATIADKRLKEQQKKKQSPVGGGVGGDLDLGSSVSSGDKAKKANEEYQRLLEAHRKFRQKIQDLDREAEIAAMGQEDQAKARIRDKYDALIAEAQTAGDALVASDKLTQEQRQQFAQETLIQILDFEKLKQQELDRLDEEQRAKERKKRAEAKAEVDAATRTEEERELLAVYQKYQSLLAIADQYGFERAELEELMQSNLDAVKKKWRDKEIADEEAKNKELRDKYGQIADDFVSISNNTFSLIAKGEHAILGYQKIIALAQIAVDTAKAIASITAAAASKSLTPIDMALKISAGLAIVFANIAKAKATLSQANAPAPPKFRKGRKPKNAMVLPGRSHDQGGVNLVDNRTGEVIGEAEGGEPAIFSKETYRNNQPIMDELIYNSLYRNGAPIEPDYPMMTKVIERDRGLSQTILQPNDFDYDRIEEIMWRNRVQVTVNEGDVQVRSPQGIQRYIRSGGQL